MKAVPAFTLVSLLGCVPLLPGSDRMRRDSGVDNSTVLDIAASDARNTDGDGAADAQPVDSADVAALDVMPSIDAPRDAFVPDTVACGGCPPHEFCGTDVRCHCFAGAMDCDHEPSNGCEIGAFDPLNCGECGRICSFPNGTAACGGGSCALASCNAGHGDCDGNTNNGCEADLMTDTRNCGSCDSPCPPRANAVAVCAASTCGFVCNTGFADCDGTAANGCEINTATDAAHCGACGNACVASDECIVGRCLAPTPSCPRPAERGCGRVTITGGTTPFAMGDWDTAAVGASPVQAMITVNDFVLDAYEVTVARFRRFWAAGHPAPTGAVLYPGGSIAWTGSVAVPDTSTGGPYDYYCTWSTAVGARELHPINCIDWPTAQAFCVWDGGRLPTEAEWEYAARGRYGAPYRAYPWGDETPSETCDRAQWNGCPGEDGAWTRRVGSFAPSGELFDLAGNAFEWMADLYTEDYTPSACWGGIRRNNPLCNDTTASLYNYHSCRGGSLNDSTIGGAQRRLRTASRFGSPLTGPDRRNFIGMRCARSVR